MNCVNCNSRLFLFNETDELFPGSEAVFCSSCRKKISPFLDDPNRYPTHAEHLAAWKQNLTSVGVTPRGMNALSAYCAYLDRITPRRADPREITRETLSAPVTAPVPQQPTQPPVSVVPVREVTGKLVELETRVETLSGKIGRMARALRFAFWAACAGGAASIGSLIALVAVLIGGA